MKKNYSTPLCRISYSAEEDIITTSGNGDVFVEDKVWDDSLWEKPW